MGIRPCCGRRGAAAAPRRALAAVCFKLRQPGEPELVSYAFAVNVPNALAPEPGLRAVARPALRRRSLSATRGYPCRMATVCPRDATEMVEVERSGVRIDACPTCRGVFLDRGELDRVLEHERRGVEEVDRDDEEFMREVTGQGHGRGHEVTGQGHERDHGRERYGFDAQTAQRLFEDYRSHKKQHKRKSLLGELLG